MSTSTPYTCAFKDSVGFMDLDTARDSQSLAISQAELNDSLLRAFPTGSFVIEDTGGGFFGDSAFVEGLPFESSLTVNTDIGPSTLSHEMYWSGIDLVISSRAKNLGGKMLFSLTSKNRITDVVKATAYPGTASSVATLIAAKFSAVAPTVFKTKPPEVPRKPTPLIPLISTTQGSRSFWYQGNRTYMEFLKNVVAKHALNSLHPFSPYVCFFNLQNEFIFKPLNQLMKTKPLLPSLQNYVCDFTNPKSNTDPDYLLDYSITFMGPEVTDRVHNQKLFSVDITDTSKSLPGKDINKFANQSTALMLPVKSDFSPRKEIKYQGLWGVSDVPFRQALSNSEYLDAALSIRWNVIIYFNPDAVSGRTINIDVFGADGLPNIQYSGIWLIIESKHKYQVNPAKASRVTITELTLARTDVNLVGKDKSQVMMTKALGASII